jgi:hypothetical protein
MKTPRSGREANRLGDPVPTAAPFFPPSGGSWVVRKDGSIVREVPTHENGGGRAVTEDEQRAIDAPEKE